MGYNRGLFRIFQTTMKYTMQAPAVFVSIVLLIMTDLYPQANDPVQFIHCMYDVAMVYVLYK
jgi:hypothetical protein